MGKAKKNVLDPREEEELISSLKYLHEEVLIKGLLYTGMRISEFIHMKRSWIDFEGEWIKVPEKQVCSCRECEKKRDGVWKPKTDEASRRIKLLQEAKEVLDPFFDEHDSVMEIIKTRQRGYDIVRSVAKRTNIQHKVFPHALRGTFASILAGKGFTAPQITGMLGWVSIKTAEDYIKISPHYQEKEIEEKW